MQKKYRVGSETDKNKKYIVRYFPKVDKYVCECPAYTFGPIGTECKHIKRLKQHLKGGEK